MKKIDVRGWWCMPPLLWALLSGYNMRYGSPAVTRSLRGSSSARLAPRGPSRIRVPLLCPNPTWTWGFSCLSHACHCSHLPGSVASPTPWVLPSCLVSWVPAPLAAFLVFKHTKYCPAMGPSYLQSPLLGNWKMFLVAQSCLTLFDPMDWSPPGSSVHGVLRARMLE